MLVMLGRYIQLIVFIASSGHL